MIYGQLYEFLGVQNLRHVSQDESTCVYLQGTL